MTFPLSGFSCTCVSFLLNVLVLKSLTNLISTCGCYIIISFCKILHLSSPLPSSPLLSLERKVERERKREAERLLGEVAIIALKEQFVQYQFMLQHCQLGQVDCQFLYAAPSFQQGTTQKGSPREQHLRISAFCARYHCAEMKRKMSGVGRGVLS